MVAPGERHLPAHRSVVAARQHRRADQCRPGAGATRRAGHFRHGLCRGWRDGCPGKPLDFGGRSDGWRVRGSVRCVRAPSRLLDVGRLPAVDGNRPPCERQDTRGPRRYLHLLQRGDARPRMVSGGRRGGDRIHVRSSIGAQRGGTKAPPSARCGRRGFGRRDRLCIVRAGARS